MIKESFYIKAIRFMDVTLNIPITPAIYQVALIIYKIKKYSLAKKIIEFNLKIQPNNYNYLTSFVDICDDLGFDDEAYSITLRLLEMYPNNFIFHYNLAVCEKRRGNIDKAIVHYKKALSLNPNHIDALNNYGIIMKTIDLRQAVKIFNKAYTLDSSDRIVALNLADCYGRIRNYCEAEKLYKKILVEYPDDKDATSDYILTLYNENKLDEARKMAESFIAKYPQYHRPYFYLALTYWQTNEITKAKDYFQKAKELGNPEAEDALSEMLEELKEDDQIP